MTSPSDILHLIEIIVVIVIIVQAIWWRLSRSRIHLSDGDSILTSIIPEKGLQAVDLPPTKAGYVVKLLVNDTSTANNEKLYYMVTLPFVSAAHLIGIPKNNLSGFTYDVHSELANPVDLEGDYGDYFTLYVGSDDQFDARYVLDPAAMVFTIDFCQQYAWEIRENLLYLAAVNQMADLSVVDEFIRQIRPAIETKAL